MVFLLELFLICLPLVFSLETHQHFELPKFAFVLFSIGIFGIGFVYDLLFQRKALSSIGKNMQMIYGALALLVVYLIWQTFGSMSPSISFWGSYERHQGLLLYGVGVYFFLLLSLYSWTQMERDRVLRAMIIGGFLVVLTALWQYISSFLPFSIYSFGSTSETLGRVYGTMGHPNFLGQFLLVPLMAHLYFFFSQHLQSEKRDFFLAGSFFLQILAFILSGNRASMIAFALCLTIFLLYHYKEKIVFSWKKITIAGVFLSVMLLVPFFYWYQQLGEAGFLRSLQTRFALIPATVELISHSPLVGYGLDSYSYAFTPYFPRGMGETEAFMYMPDRAHNSILDILVEKGLLGLLLECLFLLILAFVLKKYWKESSKVQKEFIMFLLLGSLAQQIAFLAGFPTISDTILQWLLLGLAVSVFSEQESMQKKGHVSYFVVIMVIISIGVIPYIQYLGYATYKSDVFYERVVQGKDPEKNYFEVLRSAPIVYEYLIFGLDYLENPKNALLFYRKAEEINSHDYFVYVEQMRAYAQIQEKDMMKKALNSAKSLCPECPLLYVYAGEAFERVGDHEAAKLLLEKYLELTPLYVKKYLQGNESDLPVFERERLRLFLKENDQYFSFALKILGKEVQSKR